MRLNAKQAHSYQQNNECYEKYQRCDGGYIKCFFKFSIQSLCSCNIEIHEIARGTAQAITGANRSGVKRTRS
jgi:hypothetical protein